MTSRVALVLVATLLSGCDNGVIPRDQAIQLALVQSFSAGHVVSANQGRLDQFLHPSKAPGVPATLQVWAIRIRGGRTPGDCVIGPNGTLACSADAPNVLVIQDARTGAAIYIKDEGP